MPSLTGDYTMTRPNISSKKRKHNDPNEAHVRQHQQASDEAAVSNAVLTRKIHSLPLKKRARTADPEDHNGQPHHHGGGRLDPLRVASHLVTPSSANLTPCHVCHRKPQRRADLDSYKDCEGCGRRTCYVCIRECHDWITSSAKGDGNDHDEKKCDDEDNDNDQSFEMRDVDESYDDDDNNYQAAETYDLQGLANLKKVSQEWWKHYRGHRSIICSKCCVETGPEGETMCLACLARVDGGRTG